jgi:outer membrane protein OmpA-like peptidoglycan-associated protein
VELFGHDHADMAKVLVTMGSSYDILGTINTHDGAPMKAAWMLVAAVCASLCAPAFGQTVNFGSNTPSAADWVDALEPGMRSKGIGTAPATPRAGSVEIKFALGSAQIGAESIPALQTLAAALSNERIASRTFYVIGHTDVTGKYEQNMILSKKRANAVVAFLQQQGIDRTRLSPDGRGQTTLLPDLPPDSPAHRRVEIVLRDN